METWLLEGVSWNFSVRPRIHLDALQSHPWWLRCRSHFTGALHVPSPASVEVEAMPYPRGQPDPCIFEDKTDEYSAVLALGTSVFTSLSSSGAWHS